MSAPENVAVPSVKWWQHFGGPKALVFPAFVLLVLGMYGVKQITKQPDPAAQAAATQQAAASGAASAIERTLGSAAAPATTVAPAPIPLYDYLSCSHVVPGDGAPCAPLAPWPITEEAKTIIGYQQGGIQGELSTVKTRIIADQIRNNMAGVDPCQMWLGLDRDKDMNPILTVWPNQAKAPQGATKLYDCTPSGSTKGTIPTEGAS